MYERILNETEKYLLSRKETAVPIREVWRTVSERGRSEKFSVPPTLTDFECLLDGDKRFELLPPQTADAEYEITEDEVLEFEEMEKLGLLGSQKVKLRKAVLLADEEDEAAASLSEESAVWDPLAEENLREIEARPVRGTRDMRSLSSKKKSSPRKKNSPKRKK